MKKLSGATLVRVNILLTVLIVGINLYIFAVPLWPQIRLWQRRRETHAVAGLPYKTRLDTHSAVDNKRAPIPADDRVVIPKLGLNEHIYEGNNSHLVNRGVWARPNASTPPKGSNTVLVGHRFTYDGPATFYSLDKVVAGDSIVVYWRGKEYDYRVQATTVVPPTAVEIEAPTDQPQLTVYTCTPLWSAKNRLVVKANLVKGLAQ